MKCPFRHWLAAIGCVAGGLVSTEVNAQVSPLLQLQSVNGHQWRIGGHGIHGCRHGLDNYAVEFFPDPWPIGRLDEPRGAVLSGPGWEAAIRRSADTQSGMGFFRVRGLGGTISLVTASFASAYLETSEGGTAIPTIPSTVLSTGSCGIPISGTATSGDYVNLSGEVSSNGGTTATIPMTLTGQRSDRAIEVTLTLRLEAGTGLQRCTGGVETTITIDENDALWQGKFTADNATLGFTFGDQPGRQSAPSLVHGSWEGFSFPPTKCQRALLSATDSFAANARWHPRVGRETLLNMRQI